MQVEASLELSARKFPKKTALVCRDQRMSYQEIEEQCNRLAHALSDVGVQRGDRVAVYLENSVEAVVSIFAILKAAAVFMLVNPPPKAKSLRMFWITHAKRLIAHGQKRATVEPCLGESPHVETVVLVGQEGGAVGSGHKRVVSWGDLLEQHD